MNAHRYLLPAALLALSISAQAAVTITLQPEGDNVTLKGRGSIDHIQGSSFEGSLPEHIRNGFSPDAATISNVGQGQPEVQGYMFALNGPIAFGSRQGDGSDYLDAFADADNGSIFVFEVSEIAQGRKDTLSKDAADGPERRGYLRLAMGYQPGDTLEFSQTYRNTTLADLGLTPGSFRWSWSADAGSDSVTVNVAPAAAPVAATPVPSLGIFGLLGLASAIGVVGATMSRQRKSLSV